MVRKQIARARIAAGQGPGCIVNLVERIEALVLRSRPDQANVKRSNPGAAELEFVVDACRNNFAVDEGGWAQGQRVAAGQEPDREGRPHDMAVIGHIAGVGLDADANPGLAILELPPEFSKVSGTDRERLVEATLEAAHGEKLVELREIEHAVDVANSAVEAGWENQAHEAGVYDLKEWDKQAADIKAAEYIPWLRKSGGEILARPLEGLLSGGSYGVPPATEEEIAKGRYFANKQEWADANGIVLPAKSEAA